ncbi:hypothetical protein T492DRAFT_1017000 [Pavlovales sp. CCMP2436]|nr:hypothetical protein T492DRAFT_1017000 [Pavlovales sp. CCMP2436]
MFAASGLLSKSDQISELSSLTQYLTIAAVVAGCSCVFIACFCLRAAKRWRRIGDEAQRGSSMRRKRRHAGRVAVAASARTQVTPERLSQRSMRSDAASEDLNIQQQIVFTRIALLTPSTSLVHVHKASPEKGVGAELSERRRQGAPYCQPLHPDVLEFIGGGYNASPRHTRVHPNDDADDESPLTTPHGDFEPPVGSLAAIRALDSWASSVLSLTTLGDQLKAFCSHFVLGRATRARDDRGLSWGHSRVNFEPSQGTKPARCKVQPNAVPGERSAWSTADASDSPSSSGSQSAPEPSARVTLRENAGIAQRQLSLPLITSPRGSAHVHAVLAHDGASHPRASSELVDVPAAERHGRAQGQRVLPLPIQLRGAVIFTGQRRGSASTLVLVGPRRTRVDMHSRVGMQTRINMHQPKESEEEYE